MPLEPDFDFIDDLVPANPDDDDLVLEGAAHLRGTKGAVQGTVTGDVTESRLMIDGVRTLIVRRPGVEDPLLALRNQADDADLAVLAYDAATDTTRLISIAGTISLDAPLGAAILGSLDNDPAAGGDQDAQLALLNLSGIRAGELQFQTTTLYLTNRVEGGPVFLRALGGAGVVSIVGGSPDGNARMFDVGVEVFRTSSAGVNVVRPGAATPTLGFNNDGGVIAQINANDAGPLVIQAFRTSRGIEIRGTNSADATIVGLSHDPNAGVFIRGADNTNHLTINNAGITVNGQATVGDLVPTASAHLTRKDYVDGRSQGNIAQRQIVVNGVMLLAGIQTAVGQSISVTYATPFSGATPVVQITLNAAAGSNVFGFITNSTLTGFTATVGLANAGVHWMAQGAL